MEQVKEKKKIAKNYLYNLIYQVFLLIIPLAVTPYVSRVLKEDGVGIYSFSYSIVSYFVILGALGFNYYAQREIAKKRGSQEEQNAFFWSIIFVRLITVSASILVYLALIFTNVFSPHYKLILILMVIHIISLYFDISFFFQGNEKFGKIVLRNVLIKSLGIALIFIFVKKPEDLYIYALIQACILVLSNLSLWLCLPKGIFKIEWKKIQIKSHFAPMMKLFIPTIAATIFTLMDRLLIGFLVPGTVEVNGQIKKVCDIENGMYEQAEKIVKMGATILTSLGIVMIPHNSQKIAAGEIEEVKENIYNALKFVFLLGFPLALGLLAVADNFSPWFFGPGYDKVPLLIKTFCPIIIFMGISNVFGVQYLIPMGKDIKYMIAICVGAVINLVLDIVLILNYQSLGAAIATVIGEFSVAFIMVIVSHKEMKINRILKSSLKYLVSALVMFAGCYFLSKILSPTILNTFILVGLGVVIYVVMLLILRDDLLINFFKKFCKFKKNKG